LGDLWQKRGFCCISKQAGMGEDCKQRYDDFHKKYIRSGTLLMGPNKEFRLQLKTNHIVFFFFLMRKKKDI